MKKLFKFFGIAAAVVVVLAVALVILAKVLITPERVKEAVLPLAQKTLHRDVQLGQIDISLFSGITLGNLVIQERDSSEPFVSAERVQLRYQFLPLLSGRIVVDEIRLDQPRVRVARLADGSFNFSDLTASKDADKEEVGKDEEKTADHRAIDLLVSKVGISGGSLDYYDAKIEPGNPFHFQVTNLDLGLRDINLSTPFPWTLAAQLGGGTLALEGDADLQNHSGTAKVRLTNFDATTLLPYLRDKIPGTLGGLKVDLDLLASGGAFVLDSSGKVALKGIDLDLKALPESPLRDASLTLDYSLKAELAQALLSIAPSRLAFNGLPVEIAGTVSDFKENPTLDARLTMADLELRKALAALPKGLVKGAAGLDPSGLIGVKLQLAGPVAGGAKLLQSGEILLNDVQVTAGGLRPGLTGTLALQGETLTAQQLQIRAGENQAMLDLKASNLFGKPIVLSSQLTSERFLLDPLLQGGAATAGAATPAPQDKGAKTEVGPMNLPLKADGSVRIGQTVYKGLAMENFVMNYRLDNNILTIDKLSGKTAGGTFEQTARVDLGRKGLAYSTRLQVRNVQADPFVKAFVPKLSGTVFGALDLDTELSSSGTLVQAILGSLTGNGKLTLGGGRLTGSGLVAELANYLNLPELRDLHLNQAKGSFAIEQGKIKIDSDLNAKELRMAPRGSVGLDGSVDLSLDARLAPELTRKLDKKGNISQFLTDAEGWGQLPLSVTGTATSPRFALDTKAVQDKVKERAKDEVKKQLQERVLDKLLPAGQEAGQEPQDPKKKLLQDTLKGFLGK